MPDISRKKTLDELKSEAIAELERRGYDVQGKTPAQIRTNAESASPEAKTNCKIISSNNGYFARQAKLTKMRAACAGGKKGAAHLSP